jgi:hypothetical protein
MKKSLLLTVGILILVSATGLMANTDWHGKFWGDIEGEWKGTLVDKQDPPYFEGVWTDGDDKGKCYAELEYGGHGIYKIVKGVIYNENGYEIGKFGGYFDVNIKPGYAEGEWKTLWGEYGKWQGKRILP